MLEHINNLLINLLLSFLVVFLDRINSEANVQWLLQLIIERLPFFFSQYLQSFVVVDKILIVLVLDKFVFLACLPLLAVAALFPLFEASLLLGPLFLRDLALHLLGHLRVPVFLVLLRSHFAFFLLFFFFLDGM